MHIFRQATTQTDILILSFNSFLFLWSLQCGVLKLISWFVLGLYSFLVFWFMHLWYLLFFSWSYFYKSIRLNFISALYFFFFRQFTVYMTSISTFFSILLHITQTNLTPHTFSIYHLLCNAFLQKNFFLLLTYLTFRSTEDIITNIFASISILLKYVSFPSLSYYLPSWQTTVNIYLACNQPLFYPTWNGTYLSLCFFLPVLFFLLYTFHNLATHYSVLPFQLVSASLNIIFSFHYHHFCSVFFFISSYTDTQTFALSI